MLGNCALVYVVSQCVCDYVITPHVMGREMGLNPAVILLALSVWGEPLGHNRHDNSPARHLSDHDLLQPLRERPALRLSSRLKARAQGRHRARRFIAVALRSRLSPRPFDLGKGIGRV